MLLLSDSQRFFHKTHAFKLGSYMRNLLFERFVLGAFVHVLPLS